MTHMDALQSHLDEKDLELEAIRVQRSRLQKRVDDFVVELVAAELPSDIAALLDFNGYNDKATEAFDALFDVAILNAEDAQWSAQKKLDDAEEAADALSVTGLASSSQCTRSSVA